MKKLSTFITQCIYTCHLTLTINIRYFPKQYWLLLTIDTVFTVRYEMNFNYNSFNHSLVFSLRGRAGRNQSPVM